MLIKKRFHEIRDVIPVFQLHLLSDSCIINIIITTKERNVQGRTAHVFRCLYALVLFLQFLC